LIKLLLVVAGVARAELPPPDYRDAVLSAAEARVDALIQAGRLDEAMEYVERFREEIADDPRMVYEVGLIYRYRQDNPRALRYLRRAVEEAPHLGYAWYDLGEVLLLTDGADEEARAAFIKASEMTEDHRFGWAAPFRLAELAGRRGDAEAFERWLREALRRGFSFRTVAAVPDWRGFLAQPELAEVLERLMTVYGNEDVLDAWKAAP